MCDLFSSRWTMRASSCLCRHILEMMSVKTCANIFSGHFTNKLLLIHHHCHKLSQTVWLLQLFQTLNKMSTNSIRGDVSLLASLENLQLHLFFSSHFSKYIYLYLRNVCDYLHCVSLSDLISLCQFLFSCIPKRSPQNALLFGGRVIKKAMCTKKSSCYTYIQHSGSALIQAPFATF